MEVTASLVSVPAANWSHCSSVGNSYTQSGGSRPAFCSRAVSRAQNASASSQLTLSTGARGSVNWLGFSPVTSSYCAWVTSQRATR